MIVFVNNITARLRYIIDFVAKEMMIDEIIICTNQDEFIAYNGPKINYSQNRFSQNEIWVHPHSLLFETGIQTQAIHCFEIDKTTAFFKTEGDFHFDIFAASFFLLTRYEEYLPHQKDGFGRYAHENSLAYKNGFLQFPVINYWLLAFRKVLQMKFGDFQVHTPAFKFIPTYDIDEAFSYQHKGLLRVLGAITKAIFKGKIELLNERLSVWMKRTKDPYNSFEKMNELNKKYNLNPYYFFLVAAALGKYDRNILPSKKIMQKLIADHSRHYAIGIHPSWQSGDNESLLKTEINTLQFLSGKNIETSRQHFIRFTLPQGYQNLIANGIKTDFSMGYGSINGFRASIASAYYWYDLEREAATDLLLYPFCYMEANSFFQQKFSTEQAFDEMQHYLQTVKAVNGTLVFIWHNTFLGTEKLFKGWLEIYEQFLINVAEK